MTLEAEARGQRQIVLVLSTGLPAGAIHSHVTTAVNIAENAHDRARDDGRNARLGKQQRTSEFGDAPRKREENREASLRR